MKSVKPIERKTVGLCYDHLSGRVGEQIFKFLVDSKWIEQIGEEREYKITEQGFKEFETLGLDMLRLCNSKRKMLCVCIERYGRIFYEHTGALLGTLISERFMELGWLVKVGEKQYEVTTAGHEGLKKMGISLGVE